MADDATSFQITGRNRFRAFRGLSAADAVPDGQTIADFRGALAGKQAFGKPLGCFLAHLQAQWSTLSAGLQSGLHSTVGALRVRVRAALDVPARDELIALQARIAELEVMLAAKVETHVEPAADTAAPAAATDEIAKTPAARTVAEKRSRRR